MPGCLRSVQPKVRANYNPPYSHVATILKLNDRTSVLYHHPNSTRAGSMRAKCNLAAIKVTRTTTRLGMNVVAVRREIGSIAQPSARACIRNALPWS